VSDARFWPPGTLAAHNFETPPFCVAPFLPAGGIAMLHGPPGIGKSQLALTMGLAVASGSAFLAPEYVTTRGNVLYIQLDVIPTIQQERARAAKLDGVPVAFFTATERLNVLQLPPELPAFVEAMACAPSLIIVDALRDTHDLDEDKSSTPPLVFAAWRKLFPAATFMYLHHDRKVQIMPGSSEQSFKESARGTGAWLAKADVGLHMTDVKGHLTLFFSKVRTCAPQMPLPVQLHEQTLLVELAAPTARQRALAKRAEYAALGKPWDKAEALRFLQTECKCPRRTAYRIAEELGL
jgi:hypothetical protein